METDEPQSFHEIAVTVRSADVDPVSNYIIENISGGLLLEDEEGVTGTTIKFYIAGGIEIGPLISGLRRYLTAVDPVYEAVDIHQRQVESLDWIDAYKKSTVPLMIGDAIVVKPPWNSAAFPDRIEIVLEPKMAFGTGRHESTQGCLAVLEGLDLSGRRVLDIGCGSGILCIYAAKRGACEAIGYDIDPLAVENSAENFELNGVESVCRALPGTIDDVQDRQPYDVIVVNIFKSAVVAMIGALKGRLAPGGTMILSGLLSQDCGKVETTLVQHGFDSFEIRDDNGWLTYRIPGT
jgi:ribosomal protein L11 methyltransferase